MLGSRLRLGPKTKEIGWERSQGMIRLKHIPKMNGKCVGDEGCWKNLEVHFLFSNHWDKVLGDHFCPNQVIFTSMLKDLIEHYKMVNLNFENRHMLHTLCPFARVRTKNFKIITCTHSKHHSRN
jgi:hypothetical protein